jgi:autotransporter-associated beta strand protein
LVFDIASTATASVPITGTSGLAKVGPGTLTLTGVNTYIGGTTISAGTLQMGDGTAGHDGSVAGSIVNNAALVYNLNGNQTYSGLINGSGSLTKTGNGTLTLAAPGAYSGPTVISGGVLKLQAPFAGSIGIHFIGGNNATAFFGAGGMVPMSNWNNESGYTFSGSTLANNSGNNSGATFSLSGANSVWGTGSANQLLNGYVAVSNYNPMTLTVANIPYAKYSIYAYVGDSSIGNQEQATINGTSYFYATEGGTPVTYTSITSTSPANYQSGNYIEVDGLTGSSQTVTIAGTTQQYGGLCGVEIVNAAPVVVNVNILPAATALSISAGATLDLGGGSQQVASLSDKTPGSGGNIVNSGTTASVLTLSPSGGPTTFSGMIQGGGALGTVSLVMSGSGTQVLAGSNTYTGPTTINQGTLVVDGSLASPVTINSGGVLGGSGSLGSVSVRASGQIAPGSPAGTLHISGSLSLASGAIMDYDLDTPSTSDSIFCGSLVSGSPLGLSNFDFTWTSNFGPGTYDLIETNSLPGGVLGTSTSGTIDGLPANIAVQGNDVVLNVVPEPSTLALLGAGAVGLAGFVWRRRKLQKSS